MKFIQFYLIFWMKIFFVISEIENWINQCPEKCKCETEEGIMKAICKESGYIGIPSGINPKVELFNLENNPIKFLQKDIFINNGLKNLKNLTIKNCQIENINLNAF